jgi:hypothetical protein
MLESSRLEEVLSAVILPASEVARATALAREMAAERAAAEGEGTDAETPEGGAGAEPAGAAEEGGGPDAAEPEEEPAPEAAAAPEPG